MTDSGSSLSKDPTSEYRIPTAGQPGPRTCPPRCGTPWRWSTPPTCWRTLLRRQSAGSDTESHSNFVLQGKREPVNADIQHQRTFPVMSSLTPNSPTFMLHPTPPNNPGQTVSSARPAHSGWANTSPTPSSSKGPGKTATRAGDSAGLTWVGFLGVAHRYLY